MGVHRIDEDKYLVVSANPCVGVPEEWFGWFLVHCVASDIALFGAKTEFCTINLLGSFTKEMRRILVKNGEENRFRERLTTLTQEFSQRNCRLRSVSLIAFQKFF